MFLFSFLQQLSRNLRSFRPPGEFTKSLSTVEAIPEESPEHRSTYQEDPFETGGFRGRSRSAAVTQEPKELLNVPNSNKSHSLNRNVCGEDSCVSLFTLDKCSNLMEDDFDMDEDSYDILFGDEDFGDGSIYFGESEAMTDGSCSTNPVTEVNDSAPTEESNTVAGPLVQFPLSNSAQLQAFHARLEHLILNVPDFPPAQTFVEYVSVYLCASERVCNSTHPKLHPLNVLEEPDS